jgi:hypothetical protein
VFSSEAASEEEARAAFDKKYPPGYFGRRDAFSRDGEYGEWLLDQPAVIKINGRLFVHGGLTPEVASLGLEEINERVRKGIEDLMESEEVLQNVMKVPGSFGQYHGTAEQVMQLAGQGRRLDDHLVRAAETLMKEVDDLPFAPDGPMWYRGSSLDNERLERDRVSEVLEELDARSIMVGHTVTRTGRVSTRFEGHLIRADVGMGYGRQGYAVVFENGSVSVFNPKTHTTSLPIVESPTGEGWTGGATHLSDVEMEKFLREAVVLDREKVSREGLSAEIWELEGHGMKLRGVFKDVEEDPPTPERPEARRYQHEVAAFELDRLLDIGLVPVAVIREVDGRPGALRPLSETALDLVSLREMQHLEKATPEEIVETVAQAYGLDVADLEEQVVRARVLDGLMDNLGRTDVDKLFIPAEGRVALVDQDGAFGLSTDLDPALLDPCRPLPADLRIYLMELNAEDLQEDLGVYIDAAQIQAILKRRDRVLKLCGAPEAQS